MKLRVGLFAVLVVLFWVAVPMMAADQPPEKPLQLEVRTEFEGANSIAVLKWRDMSDNELGFEVLRSDNNGEFRVVGMVGANTTSHRDKVGKYVTGGFSYKVRAFNQSGKSEDSNVASVWF